MVRDLIQDREELLDSDPYESLKPDLMPFCNLLTANAILLELHAWNFSWNDKDK